MAHRTVEAAVRDVKVQHETSYRVIIVWRKDWERWRDELRAAVDRNVYALFDQPVARTKNQLVIAEKVAEAT